LKSFQTRTAGPKAWVALIATLWLAVSFAGCGGGNRADRDTSAADNQATQAADNTGRNAGDTSDSLTPTDQSGSDADRAITQSIRKMVVDSDLSADAKNVKIITRNGVVTLRGPVDSQAEKDFIANAARSTAGVASVDDQTEVAAKSGS
jgi:osmotically-inducible protein OsmY